MKVIKKILWLIAFILSIIVIYVSCNAGLLHFIGKYFNMLVLIFIVYACWLLILKWAWR